MSNIKDPRKTLMYLIISKYKNLYKSNTIKIQKMINEFKKLFTIHITKDDFLY